MSKKILVKLLALAMFNTQLGQWPVELFSLFIQGFQILHGLFKISNTVGIAIYFITIFGLCL